jgi:UDP-N-acetylglucosamine transferase subunit ALG13
LIFATVGTHHQPFERLVHAAIVLAAGRELVIQHGHTPRLHSARSVRWQRWLAPDEMEAMMSEATLVIAHAGVATVVDAVRAGQRPLVMARRRHLGEHVDDHQLQIVEALAAMDLIVPAGDDGVAPQTTSVCAERVAWPPPGLKAAVRRTALGA